MADVTIESGANTADQQQQDRAVVFTSDLTGYVFYLLGNNLVYKKTTDGGSSWGSAQTVHSGTCYSYSIWFDGWTTGDSGTRVHVWVTDITDTDRLFYRYLDTSDDSIGSSVEIEDALTVAAFAQPLSGTKTRGGNLIVAAKLFDGQDTWVSTDSGASWSQTGVAATEENADRIQLFPGNETDDNDVWALFWDASANELSLKVYDWSSPGWTETSIASSMVEPTKANSTPGMSGAIRHSDGHLIVAAWSEFDSATGDLRIWNINGAASISELTNVIANADDCHNTAVFIDQNTDDIYVGYLGKSDGSETISATVTVNYKKSTDGGSNWGSETAYSEDAADDFRALWSPVGGTSTRFYLAWFNDDLSDIVGGYTNSVAITPPDGGPTTRRYSLSLTGVG